LPATGLFGPRYWPEEEDYGQERRTKTQATGVGLLNRHSPRVRARGLLALSCTLRLPPASLRYGLTVEGTRPTCSMRWARQTISLAFLSGLSGYYSGGLFHRSSRREEPIKDGRKIINFFLTSRSKEPAHTALPLLPDSIMRSERVLLRDTELRPAHKMIRLGSGLVPDSPATRDFPLPILSPFHPPDSVKTVATRRMLFSMVRTNFWKIL
jgi:hypothetical protein